MNDDRVAVTVVIDDGGDAGFFFGRGRGGSALRAVAITCYISLLRHNGTSFAYPSFLSVCPIHALAGLLVCCPSIQSVRSVTGSLSFLSALSTRAGVGPAHPSLVSWSSWPWIGRNHGWGAGWKCPPRTCRMQVLFAAGGCDHHEDVISIQFVVCISHPLLLLLLILVVYE